MGASYRGQRAIRRENDLSGGLNNGTAAFDLQDNQCTEQRGFDTDAYPDLQTAKGRTKYGPIGYGETRLLVNFLHQRLVRVVKLIVGTPPSAAVFSKLQYSGTTPWSEIPNPSITWIDLPGTFSNRDWDATNFNEKLILVNGFDAPQKIVGLTLSALGGSPPVGAKYVTNDNVRVWMAKGDVIHYCAFENEEDWTSAENSGSVQYYTPNGGDITGLKNFYGRKCVWKKDSFSEIQGVNYFNFQLVEISNDIGCMAYKTIQEVGDTMFWLGQSDVYAYKGGKPSPIGQRIRTHLDAINWTYIDKCCAFTDGLRYYLNLVIDGATEPNIRLVYDPRYDVWMVPAVDEQYRYGVQINGMTFVGDASGQTWKINDGDLNDGQPVSWSITSKPFDEGFPEAEKLYAELHFQGEFTNTISLQASVSTEAEGNDFTSIDYDPLDGNNKNSIIPLDEVPLTYAMRYRISGTGKTRLHRVQRYFRVARVQR